MKGAGHKHTHNLMPHAHIPSGNLGKCQKDCSGPWLAESLLANGKIHKHLRKNMKAAGHDHFTGCSIIKCSVQRNQFIVAKE